jgi:large conductance mechanosensitive channel
VVQQGSLVKEFRDFVMRGNVVDLAVAVVIGAAFGALVTSFVNDILMQIIAAIVGKPDFGRLTLDIGKSTLFYGNFLNALITFLSIAAAVFFFVVKPLNMFSARIAKAPPADAPPPPADIVLLPEIRDLLKTR